MTEQLSRTGMNPPEDYKVGMPGEHGFYVLETVGRDDKSERGRVYEAVADFGKTIEEWHNGDPSELSPAEHEAQVFAAEIGDVLSNHANFVMDDYQTDMLAAVEAYSAAAKAAMEMSDAEHDTLYAQTTFSAVSAIEMMTAERRSRLESSINPAEKDSLMAEIDELSHYGDVLKTQEDRGENGGLFVAELDSAVGAYKKGDVYSEERETAYLATAANAYYAKYAREIASRSVSEQESESEVVETDAATEKLSRPEQIAKFQEEEMRKIYDDPDKLQRAAADARTSFFTERLQVLRDRYALEPSPQNEGILKASEKEGQDFTQLLQLATQWREEKLINSDIADFASYVAARRDAAERELMQAFDGTDGILAADSVENVNFTAIESAYRAGWSDKPYSLNGRITRVAAQKAFERVDNVS